ncbi:MAG: SPFH domain-containing protein [Planctomycetota bacterium]|jgi:regulator of protease activity HflC (stomatin/prohibitin superfamily)
MAMKINKKLKLAGIAVGGGLILFLVILANTLITIDADEVGVVKKKIGTSLPSGVVVAVEPGYQGIQLEVLKAGWHVVNPIWTDVETKPAVNIPNGMKGLVNRKVGKAPENRDDIVVPEGYRGYQLELLDPGLHYLNPYVYEIEFVRPIEVPPLHVGVETSKIGKPSEGKAVVGEGDKGVREKVLMPGTYWRNPKAVTVDIVPAIEVPRGSVGVIRSRVGTRSDKDLVDEGEQGIQRSVLRPGTYYLNPVAFEEEVHPAVAIEAGFVGVVVLQTGPEPKEANAIIVERDERGVQPYTLPAGLHYLNPYEYKVTTVDSRVQKYEMSASDVSHAGKEVKGDDRLAFPSADGFTIKVDTSIEWQIETNRIPAVVAGIGNTDEIVEKIIRPNAREIGRLEGSKLKAEDFIKGDKREAFVGKFSETLRVRCAEKGIIIHKALVREVLPPEEIAEPLKEREVALLMQQTNVEKQAQAKSEALLEEEKAKIEQRKELIKADTAKQVAETEANRAKEVAKIRAEQLKEVAAVEQEQQALILEKQKLEAQGIREIAEAEAYKARSLVEADGALDKKLKAWTTVMSQWADNANLVPRVVVGGSGADGSGGGLTGQELILQLMAIEHLDRFVQGAGDAGDSPKPPVKKKPKESKPAGWGAQ